MTLAPKTKLWIGVGVFSLVVMGLLSLNSDTFSGNLSLVMTQGNPELCGQLKTACAQNGQGSPACDNFAKLMCTEIEKTATSQSTGNATSAGPDQETTSGQTSTPRPRGRVQSPTSTTPTTSPATTNNTRGAAPSPSDNSTQPNAVTQDELERALQAFPESTSQGQLDTSEMR